MRMSVWLLLRGVVSRGEIGERKEGRKERESSNDFAKIRFRGIVQIRRFVEFLMNLL